MTRQVCILSFQLRYPFEDNDSDGRGRLRSRRRDGEGTRRDAEGNGFVVMGNRGVIIGDGARCGQPSEMNVTGELKGDGNGG